MIVWRVGRKRGAIPEQFLCVTGEKGTGRAGLCTRAELIAGCAKSAFILFYKIDVFYIIYFI